MENGIYSGHSYLRMIANIHLFKFDFLSKPSLDWSQLSVSSQFHLIFHTFLLPQNSLLPQTIRLKHRLNHKVINSLQTGQKEPSQSSMCHPSCASCIDQSFTGCLSCTGTNLLYESVCYCSYAWSSNCTSEGSFQGIFRLFQSFYVLSFILLIILYNLKVKLPISYRVLSGLQTISCLIYSRVIYIDFEDFFVMRYFNLLSGPFRIDYRLQSLSTDHALQTYILFGFFIFMMFFLYYPSQTFHKKIDSLWDYLKQNILEYFENFYYFGGKMMFLYIGMFIQATSKGIPLIVHMALFCLLILIVFARLIMEYHKNSLSEQIYEGPLYLYSMLANATTIGLPLIGQNSMLLIIYLVPLGLLILIAILNKDIEILSRNSIQFLIIEVIMGGMGVAVVLTNDMIRTYVLLIIQVICGLIMGVEMGMTYYGGIQLSSENEGKKSNKISPMLNQSVNEVEMEDKKSVEGINNDKNKKKGKYF